jgi:hypothetical protein
MAVGVGRLGLDNDFVGPDVNKGHVHLIDGRVYNADEIATETVVVDGVGQKLTLRIENVRGGGGGRGGFHSFARFGLSILQNMPFVTSKKNLRIMFLGQYVARPVMVPDLLTKSKQVCKNKVSGD